MIGSGLVFILRGCGVLSFGSGGLVGGRIHGGGYWFSVVASFVNFHDLWSGGSVGGSSQR